MSRRIQTSRLICKHLFEKIASIMNIEKRFRHAVWYTNVVQRGINICSTIPYIFNCSAVSTWRAFRLKIYFINGLTIIRSNCPVSVYFKTLTICHSQFKNIMKLTAHVFCLRKPVLYIVVLDISLLIVTIFLKHMLLNLPLQQCKYVSGLWDSCLRPIGLLPSKDHTY